ncbi:MAG TPA: hypothetical protein VF581_07810 [Flavobacterium sp.]|jgi:site-specific DNA-adenine methylase
MKNYPGNKYSQSVYKKIINEIPRCDTFREWFAGSAAVSAVLTIPAAALYLNDLSDLVHAYLINKFSGSTVTKDCTISLINNLPDNTDKVEVIFLDPPYRLCTRPHSQIIYEHEMSDDDHVQLLTAVLAKANSYLFIIIHPDDEMYNTMLAGWRRVEIKIRYRNKTSHEVLYMNYPAPEALQDTRFLGSGCHERQRIKRKGDRLVVKLSKLPALERNYVLERLKPLIHQL